MVHISRALFEMVRMQPKSGTKVLLQVLFGNFLVGKNNNKFPLNSFKLKHLPDFKSLLDTRKTF